MTKPLAVQKLLLILGIRWLILLARSRELHISRERANEIKSVSQLRFKSVLTKAR